MECGVERRGGGGEFIWSGRGKERKGKERNMWGPVRRAGHAGGAARPGAFFMKLSPSLTGALVAAVSCLVG